MFSLGTMIATWSANEIQIQPDLKIEDTMFSLYWDQTGKLVYVDTEMIEDDFHQDETYMSIPSITVRNVGKATAKNILYDWRFEDNLSDMSAELGKIGRPIRTDISKENELTVTEETTGNQYLYYLKEETSSYISTEREEYITMPVFYLDLLSKYCYEVFPDTDDDINYGNFFTEDELPKIVLDIIYYNVEDVKEKTTISLQFRPIRYKTLDGKVGGCTFTVKTETK